MKLFTLIFVVSLITLSTAHMTLLNPIPRSHPLASRFFDLKDNEVDFDCLEGPLNKGKNDGKCKKKELRFPCAGYSPNSKLVTQLKAGQVISISFYSQEFDDDENIVIFDKKQKMIFVNKEKFDAKHLKANQGRHNGGTCEFALSYDGGKHFTKIASYHETCPDMAYNWTVKIPENAPSCKNGVDGKKLGDCIFSWTWLSSSIDTQEFYQNCADIEINSTTKEPLEIINITQANLQGVFDKTIKIPGKARKCRSDSDEDGHPGRPICNAASVGPVKEDINNNLNLKINNVAKL